MFDSKGKQEQPPELAFPLYAVIPGKIAGQATAILQPGMTLRDFFAGQAMAGLLAGRGTNNVDGQTFAMAAYELADELMERRKHGNL